MYEPQVQKPTTGEPAAICIFLYCFSSSRFLDFADFSTITFNAFPKNGRLSQSVMKEKPRKRPRVPPKSATKEVTVYISCSVLMVVFLETAHREKRNPSVSRLTRSFPPTKWYFLYWQGFRQPVNAVMSSKSAVLSSSNSSERSLQET